MNANFKVIGLSRLGIKPESTAPDANALTTWPSELLSGAHAFTVIVSLKHYFGLLFMAICYFSSGFGL